MLGFGVHGQNSQGSGWPSASRSGQGSQGEVCALCRTQVESHAVTQHQGMSMQTAAAHGWHAGAGSGLGVQGQKSSCCAAAATPHTIHRRIALPGRANMGRMENMPESVQPRTVPKTSNLKIIRPTQFLDAAEHFCRASLHGRDSRTLPSRECLRVRSLASSPLPAVRSCPRLLRHPSRASRSRQRAPVEGRSRSTRPSRRA